MKMDCLFFLSCRAEPLLTQIKADRTVVVSPVFDKVNFDDLEVIKYVAAAQAFDWALWCMYEGFSPDYYKLKDSSLPGKYVRLISLVLSFVSKIIIQ